jgi:hypothetical protein
LQHRSHEPSDAAEATQVARTFYVFLGVHGLAVSTSSFEAIPVLDQGMRKTRVKRLIWIAAARIMTSLTTYSVAIHSRISIDPASRLVQIRSQGEIPRPAQKNAWHWGDQYEAIQRDQVFARSRHAHVLERARPQIIRPP